MTARKKGGEGIASTQSQPGGYKGVGGQHDTPVASFPENTPISHTGG